MDASLKFYASRECLKLLTQDPGLSLGAASLLSLVSKGRG